MLPDPTERNVNPLLFQARVRTVKKLVLTLAIHDKNVTMAKTAHVSFTVRTRLALPFEECSGAEAYRHKKKRTTDPPNSGSSSQCHPAREFPPRQRFRFAAVGKSPSAHQGFIRSAIAHHILIGSGEHRAPVCGPIAVPCPCAYEHEHEEVDGTDHAVWYDPFLTQSAAAQRTGKVPVSVGHPETTKVPTSLFSPPVSILSFF